MSEVVLAMMSKTRTTTVTSFIASFKADIVSLSYMSVRCETKCGLNVANTMLNPSHFAVKSETA